MRLLDEGDRFVVAAGGRPPAELRRSGVPPAIRQAVLEHMSVLSADACLVTRAAGLLGVPAEEKLVAAVAGLAPARAARALTRALQSGPLEEKGDDLYGFRHPLAAQAACEDAPGPQRRPMHLRAAQELQRRHGTADPARLAHHFKEAGRWTQWARHAEVAAAVARSAGDDRCAARLLEEALFAPGLARAARIRMAVELGHAAVSNIDPETAIGLLQRTLDEERIPVGIRGELRFCLARLRRNAGETGAWRPEMALAVEELRRRPELAARAMTDLAQPALSGESLEHDMSWLRLGVREAARTSDPATKVEISAQRAAVLLGVGDPAGWEAVNDIPGEVGSLEDQVQRLPPAYGAVSVASMQLGHHQRAESLLAVAARIAEEIEPVQWDPWRASAELVLDWRMGRWPGLEARARDLIRATASKPPFRGNEVVLGSLLAARGQADEAEQVLSVGAVEGEGVGTYVAAVATLAGIRLDRGDVAGAHQLVAPPLDAIERKGTWVWAAPLAPMAVRALLACGEGTEARRLTAAFGAGLYARETLRRPGRRRGFVRVRWRKRGVAMTSQRAFSDVPSGHGPSCPPPTRRRKQGMQRPAACWRAVTSEELSFFTARSQPSRHSVPAHTHPACVPGSSRTASHCRLSGAVAAARTGTNYHRGRPRWRAWRAQAGGTERSPRRCSYPPGPSRLTSPRRCASSTSAPDTRWRKGRGKDKPLRLSDDRPTQSVGHAGGFRVAAGRWHRASTGPTARRLSLGWQDARFGAMFALHGRGRQLAYPYRRIHNNRGVNDAHQVSPP